MGFRITTLLPWLGLLSGCTTTAHYGPDTRPGRPSDDAHLGVLELGSDELDFGTVPLGEQGQAGLELTNVGEGQLRFLAVEITPQDAPFRFDEASLAPIEPGGSATISASFEPDAAGPHSAWLIIQADEIDRWSHAVFLRGEGTGAELELRPATVTWPEVEPGCEQQRQVTMTNTGDRPLTISRLGLDAPSDELWLEDAPELPLLLDPGHRYQLRIHYLPIDQGEDEALLWLVSDDPLEPERELVVSAACPEAVTVSESFVWLEDVGADVVVTANGTTSMLNFEDSILAELTNLHQALAQLEVDQQLAVIRDNYACVQGDLRWLDSSHGSEEAQAAITAMLDAPYTSLGDLAFDMLQDALDQTAPGEGNEGLLREGTGLNVVGISDGPDGSSMDWSYHLTWLQSRVENPDDLAVHAVGGDYPGGCEGARAFTGYYEATVATGGAYQSICSPGWGAALAEAIATNQGGTRSLGLSHEPVPESLELWLDGERVTEGWSIAGASITFELDHRPSSGSEIDVSYVMAASCD